ncbi:MAG: recombinase family protein [Sphingomonas sp.]|nr:recombinase family protein [Sphingomonas sp.]
MNAAKTPPDPRSADARPEIARSHTVTAARIGYARPGLAGLDITLLCERLEAAGCAKLFAESGRTGALANRLRGKALRALAEGDMLVVINLDQIGHSLVDIVAVLQRVFDIGADLCLLDDDVDTSRDPAARRTLMAVIEAQSRLVSARARDGLANRRAEGKRIGAPVRLHAEHWPELKAMIAAKTSAADMITHFKVSRSTLWNFRRRMEAAEAAQISGASVNS